MKTGAFYGLSFEEYRAIKAINVSGLKRLKQSPLHYWADNLAPDREEKEESAAMYRGTAIHTAVLEPKRFAEEYRLAPKADDYPDHLNTVEELKAQLKIVGLPLSGSKADLILRLKEASLTLRFFDDVLKEHEKYKLLTRADWEACEKIAKNVRTSPTLSVLFESGAPEVTLVWIDPETGEPCKARLDWLNEEYFFGLDVKSAADASNKEFTWAFERYGYWQQAAWYLDGIKAVFGADGTFIFTAFEPAFPYAMALYSPDEESIADGRAENRKLLYKYIECKKANSWPGYSDQIQIIGRPIKKQRAANTTAEGTLSHGN